MYKIRSSDRQLVDEFRQNPVGRHSPDLQRVLNRLRGGSRAGKYCLICTKPFAEWQLARMSGRRGEPPVPVPGEVFTDLKAAEWAVFRRRWRELTGEDLN